MNNQNMKNDTVWEMIENEKKKDRFIKRVSRVAWGSTIVILLVFLAFTIMDLSMMIERYQNKLISLNSVIQTVVPFAIILGSLSLIIAILSTVGVFLRLRTTSLAEIQQRLANLEELVTSGK